MKHARSGCAPHWPRPCWPAPWEGDNPCVWSSVMWNCPSDHFHLSLPRLLGMSSCPMAPGLKSEILAKVLLPTSGVCPPPHPRHCQCPGPGYHHLSLRSPPWSPGLPALAQISAQTYGMDEQMSGRRGLRTHGFCGPDLNSNLSSITQLWALFLARLSLSFLTHKWGMIMAVREVVVRMKKNVSPKCPAITSVLTVTFSSPPAKPPGEPGPSPQAATAPRGCLTVLGKPWGPDPGLTGGTAGLVHSTLAVLLPITAPRSGHTLVAGGSTAQLLCGTHLLGCGDRHTCMA